MIIDCKKIAEKWKSEIKIEASLIGATPLLAVIVPDESSSKASYCKSIQKSFSDVGFGVEFIKTENAKWVRNVCARTDVDGVIVLTPCENQNEFISEILPQKDVECMTNENRGKLFSGEPLFAPCTPYGIMHLLKEIDISLTGKLVSIINRTATVGKPLAELLLNENATVTVCHSKTKDLELIVAQSDIIVSAVGAQNFEPLDHAKVGATIIDAGICSFEGKIRGDANTKSLANYVNVTPVPHGVGLLTSVALIENTFKAYKLNCQKLH